MTDTISLLIIAGIALALACVAWSQPRVNDRAAYWNHSFAGLDETPDRFFAQIYQELRDRLESHGVSLSGLEYGPKSLFETRSVFSSRPRYLCARYSHLTYYLYASPTPAGFFVSSSLFSKYLKGDGTNWLANVLGNLYFRRQTLFQHDALIMFHEAIHTVVLEVLDRYAEDHELRPIEAYERRPVYHAFYGASVPSPPAPVIDAAALLQYAASSQSPSQHQSRPEPDPAPAPMPNQYKPPAYVPGYDGESSVRGPAVEPNAEEDEDGSAGPRP